MRIVDASELELACDVLKKGGLVAFPTETVYGLGGNAYSEEAVAAVFQLKKRAKFNPMSVCYPSFEAAGGDVQINDEAVLLAKAFLPGPLTIVLKKQDNSRVSSLCSAGKDTLGIRVPSNALASDLLSKLNFPLVAPSANLSSHLSTTTAQAVGENFEFDDLLILDGGRCSFGIESTIVDLSGDEARILRRGAISEEEILERCGINLKFQGNSGNLPYRPSKPLIMNIKKVKESDALLAFGSPIEGAHYCLNLSETSDLSEAAQNLFIMLRKLDNTDAKRICVMQIPDTGLGRAINDRLRKASTLK